MALGQKNSYVTDAPLQKNYIGEALSEVEDNSFKYRQEKRLLDAKKKAEEEAKLKDVADWDGKFDPNVIGYNSIDSPLVSMAMKAKERAGNITRELYSPNISTDKKIALMSERNKLAQSFDIANQTPQIIKEKVKSLEEGIKAGKYNSRDVDFMENISKQLEAGKYELNYDERGTPKVKIYQTDENGKPTGILQETSLGDLVKSFEPKLAFNYEDYKDKTLSKVTPEQFGYQNGANVVKGARVSEGNKQQAKTYADVIVSDPNKLYEAQYLFKEKDPEKLRKILENDFITSIPGLGEVQSLDTGYLNYSKPDKTDKPETPVIMETNKINLTEDVLKSDKGGRIVIDRKGIKPQAVTFEKGIPLENIGGEQTKLNNLNIKAILINDKNQILFTGTVLDSKGGTEKDFVDPSSNRTGATYKRVSRVASGETEGLIASKMGFENVNQLKEYMNKIQPKQQAKPQETTRNQR